GIIETLRQMTEIMSRGGGVGINISSLRPRHSYVKGVNGRSSGAVSWGALYSFVTGLLEQGGSRRGALMLILNDWHPDIFDFINSKRTAGQITNANISVGVSDKLMDAVKADGDWDLMFPDSSDPDYDDVWDGDLDKWIASGRKVNHYRTVKARDVWNAIIESAWASAEPGVWFRERANKMSNSYYYPDGLLVATNPCGEQSLPGFAVCNLGAINLARFYDEDTHDVDWEKLESSTCYATRFLDNIIDNTPYFFEENERQQLSERRVGLNNMGLAELLIKLGIRYGSDESVLFINRLYGCLARAIYDTSIELAREKGAFPQFDAEKFVQSGFMQSMPEDIREKVSQTGIRNVTL
ncbi:MAG: ribonucleoside-diphosphate reductase, adenosylcobalamin-dependent, partial [Anaerolineae bacterium]|nr:ribonucleoside-diphosphate reductase, adenosylcobalamin-dependent [Anaerolineae bacterium]